MRSGLILRELTRNQFPANLDACAGVYAAAMNPPAEQLPGRHSIMERHAGYAAFRAMVAIAARGAGAPPAPGRGRGG